MPTTTEFCKCLFVWLSLFFWVVNVLAEHSADCRNLRCTEACFCFRVSENIFFCCGSWTGWCWWWWAHSAEWVQWAPRPHGNQWVQFAEWAQGASWAAMGHARAKIRPNLVCWRRTLFEIQKTLIVKKTGHSKISEVVGISSRTFEIWKNVNSPKKLVIRKLRSHF